MLTIKLKEISLYVSVKMFHLYLCHKNMSHEYDDDDAQGLDLYVYCCIALQPLLADMT